MMEGLGKYILCLKMTFTSLGIFHFEKNELHKWDQVSSHKLFGNIQVMHNLTLSLGMTSDIQFIK